MTSGGVASRRNVFLANAALMLVYLSWWLIFDIVLVSIGQDSAWAARYALYLSWTISVPSFLVSVWSMGGAMRLPSRLFLSGVIALAMTMAGQFLLLALINHIHIPLGGEV